jgi:hypothetical protein
MLPSLQKMGLKENPTLVKAGDELENVGIYVYKDRSDLVWLHKAMGVGDERLPFALAVTSEFYGLYGFANYNIGTVRTLLSIFQD